MITKEMLVGEIVEKGEKYIEVLVKNGMGCLGCPSSRFESLVDACDVHGLKVEPILEELNKLEEGK